MRMTICRLMIIAVLASVFFTGCARIAEKNRGKMIVAASIAPLADFSREVGGKYVHVELLVPPAASPHTYQLQPDQMAMLSKASVLVLNGVGLEFWADSAIDAANNPKLIVVRTSDGLKLVDSTDEDEKDGNPHVWLDPIDAIHQVKMIRDAYIKADPEHTSAYKLNAEHYIDRLKKLDRDIQAEVKTYKYRSFIAFHPAWVYFAKRYGLVEAAVIERSPGREPSPAEIRDIIDTAKKLHVKAIFAEPQFSTKAADVIAEEAGAKVLFLDPMGKPPNYDYIRTMRDDLHQLSEALK